MRTKVVSIKKKKAGTWSKGTYTSSHKILLMIEFQTWLLTVWEMVFGREN